MAAAPDHKPWGHRAVHPERVVTVAGNRHGAATRGHGTYFVLPACSVNRGKDVRLVSDSLPSEPDVQFSRIRLSG